MSTNKWIERTGRIRVFEDGSGSADVIILHVGDRSETLNDGAGLADVDLLAMCDEIESGEWDAWIAREIASEAEWNATVAA